MAVTLVFLGRLQDVAGVAESEATELAGLSVAEAMEQATKATPALREALFSDSVRVAINGEFADGAALLADGDELAFLPPVSGGWA